MPALLGWRGGWRWALARALKSRWGQDTPRRTPTSPRVCPTRSQRTLAGQVDLGQPRQQGQGLVSPSEQALLGLPLSWVTDEGTVDAAHAQPHPSSPAAATGPLNQFAPGLFTFYESVRALGKKKKKRQSIPKI